jgi:membrane-bound lytic murein transglycosylase D
MVHQLYVPKDFRLETAVLVPKHRVKTLVVGSEEFFEHHESLRDRVRVRYRVKDGDSLDSLATRFDLSVGSIARINGFSRYSKLEKGREIILYVPARDADKVLANVSARQ